LSMAKKRKVKMKIEGEGAAKKVPADEYVA